MDTEETPYADLTPEFVLDAVEAFGQPVDGRLLQLNSYENRVFQVGLDDGGAVIAKFYRPKRWNDAQILEEHQFALDLHGTEVPVVAPLVLERPLTSDTNLLGTPPTLGMFRGFRLALTPRRGGRPPELEDPEVLSWLGRYLARLHTVGAAKNFQSRNRLDVSQTGYRARDWLVQHEAISPDQMGPWLAAANQALDLAQAAFDGVSGLQYRRVHGDCHPGNILWTPEGPHFVDLDDACMAPAVQDMWMLLSGDETERRVQLHAMLDGYETLAEFDWRELKLIEALRTLRMLHHSAWIARRWHDPAFPSAFPWFGDSIYWQEQTRLLQQQSERMEMSQM